MFKAPPCTACQTEKEWRICYYCHGTGDNHETEEEADPLMDTCPECYGEGGWWQCPLHHNEIPAATGETS